MEEKTKKMLYEFFAKAKETTIKTANVVAQKSSELYSATKTHVKNMIDDYKEKKELEKRIAIQECDCYIQSVISNIEDGDIKEFISELGESPTELTHKLAKHIKEVFPLPKEQTVIWACFTKKTNRYGGLIVTDKGLFYKTLVDVFTEKAINKDNRKVSELFYYPWEIIDSIAIDSDFMNDSFSSAFDKYTKKKSNERLASLNYYSSRQQVLNAGAIVVDGVLLDNELLFARNNGFGNNPKAGFGLFAEQMNNRADILNFKNAKVIGGDNAKNGADRLVNGVRYQTKYYKTPARSVGATFDNKGDGLYRYWNADGTPMKTEVPKGQGPKAIETMRNRIIQGKVKTVINGKEYAVTDPKEAENLIVEGHYTYEQAVNASKPGTIESLTYDVQTGAVVAFGVFSISTLISSFLCYRKTHDLKESMISGLLAGGKAGALSLGSYVLVAQLARTKTFANIIGKSSTKAGAVSAVAGFVVFSIPETFNFATKKISSAQYATNLAVLAASTIGGAVGAYAGAALGGAIGTAAGAGAGSVPLAIATGTGGFVGGGALGAGAGFGVSQLIDLFFEGDDKRITRLFNAIAMVMFTEYLLDENEISEFVKKMNATSDRILKKLLTDVHASNNQEAVIRKFIKSYLDEIVKNREKKKHGRK